ncbi:hypothetical protein N8146_05870 [Ascidiaceihabitans sp.]|nr:hypothetical protein [Ascidiaceihabitans sp.]
MAYIGNIPAESYASFETETFSVSATTNYTLSHAVTNENEIRLVINGVVQQPGSGKAYTASGTTLTLSSATVSGDVMYAVYLGRALQTVNPPNASVGLSQLSATGTKDATTFLRGDNTFASAGGTNTPAFQAYLSSNQTISHDTETKVAFNTEDFDTDNAYDNSTNYRFTPQTAGKYFVYGNVNGYIGTSNINSNRAILKKNGSTIKYVNQDYRNNPVKSADTTISIVVDMNGSSDYIELFTLMEYSSSATVQVLGNSNRQSSFGAYKIIE